MIKRLFLLILCGFFLINAGNDATPKNQYKETMTIEDMEGLVKLSELVVKVFFQYSIIPGLLSILVMRYSNMNLSGKLLVTGLTFLTSGAIATYIALKDALKRKSRKLLNEPKKFLLSVFAITGGIQASIFLTASLIAKGMAPYNQ